MFITCGHVLFSVFITQNEIYYTFYVLHYIRLLLNVQDEGSV
jgi:hypothetical protein